MSETQFGQNASEESIMKMPIRFGKQEMADILSRVLHGLTAVMFGVIMDMEILGL